MKKDKMKEIILKDLAAMIEDSSPKRKGQPRGGGWNQRMSTRQSRGIDHQGWAKYQRTVDRGC
jgi:hypothetical protein